MMITTNESIMNATRILKTLSFYVVLCAVCLLIWLVYGFNKPVMQPVRNSARASEIMLSTNDGGLDKPPLIVDSPDVMEDRESLVPPALSKPSPTLIPRRLRNCLNMKNSIKSFKNRKQVMSHNPQIYASCDRLRSGDRNEARKVGEKRRVWHSETSDTDFLTNLYHNCSHTRHEFSNVFYSSLKEQSFPIAFEMLVYYKEGRVQQYIRLLKYLYRPYNAYCIHIDDKSPQWWKDQLVAFASCFPNIVIASDPVVIKYATATILYAHMRCLHNLLYSKLKWNYVVTLHATELPLVTNREMVEQLMLLNGTNFINQGVQADTADSQVQSWMKYKVKSINKGTWVVLSKEQLDKPPHNITVYKSGSSANSALSRKLVQFMFNNHKVQDLLKWLEDVHSAVEFFFSTVNQMPGAPGHSVHIDEIAHREWSHEIRRDHTLCKDMKIVHDICIVSSSDLPRLSMLSKFRKYWFFNKYFINYDYVVMDCMEDLLLQRNVKEYERDCGKDHG